jgi:SAM-dependent methyltransferase
MQTCRSCFILKRAQKFFLRRQVGGGLEAREYALMDAAEERMWWYRALHARLSDALKEVRGRVLDAGCGTGGLLARLARRDDLSPVGLEYSPQAARRAAEKSGLPVASGSVNALPFADARFSAAIVADVLCHAAVDPALALAELRRVLCPGGLIVVNMPAYAWLFSAHDRRVQNVRRQTASELRQVLEVAGFIRPVMQYWNGLLLPLMAAQRKLRARREDGASDVATFPPWLNATFHAITEFERRSGLALPAGGSILGIAVKP